MFVQVIQGRVPDADALRSVLDEWYRKLAPGAVGWLGTTAGVTADGDFVAVVRFESAQAAQRNSDRPEQHQWWLEAAKRLDGEAEFHDCPTVDSFLEGGSDEAGFVQVIQGTVSDAARLWSLLPQLSRLDEYRPEIIGGTVALDQNGSHVTQAVYFTSEREAREGEAKEPPADLQAALEESDGLLSDVRYYDLTDPWLYTP
jgi:hypothetical protein